MEKRPILVAKNIIFCDLTWTTRYTQHGRFNTTLLQQCTLGTNTICTIGYLIYYNKYMLEMYNSVLDVNFFDITFKPILYCYGIVQYLNLVQHGLLSCDNYFFLVIIQAFHDSSFKHRYQTIKWLFKNIFLFRSFSAQKKREQAFYKKLSRISEIYSLERGPFLFVACNTTATKNTEDKILSLGDGRVCHSSSDSQIQTSPLTFLPISLPIMNLAFTVR